MRFKRTLAWTAFLFLVASWLTMPAAAQQPPTTPVCGGQTAPKGVPRDKIETIGMGEKQPVVQCDQKNMKELIVCLQPNRRVEVEVKGEARK